MHDNARIGSGVPIQKSQYNHTDREIAILDQLNAEWWCNLCDEEIILLGNQWSCKQEHPRCTMQGCIPRKTS